MPAVRRPGITSVATLAGFLATAAAVHLVAPEWSRAAGLDVWNTAAARADLDAARCAADRIDAGSRRVQAQLAASDGVVARVAAGRLTLADGVAELVAVNADRGGWADGLRFAYPDAATHRQRVARYVLSKLAGRPAPGVSARLEAEYRTLAGEPRAG